jgi:Predicted membrane protein (DUF2254)
MNSKKTGSIQHLSLHFLSRQQSFKFLGVVVVLSGLILLIVVAKVATQITIRDEIALQNFVGTLAEVMTGILGFTISVVAIVVQLSADRFTPKVTELFLRERINLWMIGFLIVETLFSVWTVLSFSMIKQPLGLIYLNLYLGTLAFLILIPYFWFVFNFLQPTSIIQKIEQQARQSVASTHRHAISCSQAYLAHKHCLAALDEIKAIAMSAIQKRESAIVIETLDSLKQFLMFYATVKARLPDQWFALTPALQRDPDFISVDIALLKRTESQKSWVELKVFRLYQSIFTDALHEFREACYMISINTREIAEIALQTSQETIVTLAIKFFNTYLRAAINTQDIRTGYTLLKQYRLTAEAAIARHQPHIALEIAQYFRYYSLTAYKMGQLFLCETLAFDLVQLAQCCYPQHPELADQILQIILKIDQDPEGEHQEATLRGVRKSQAKLAAYYLQQGHQNQALLIFQDMQHEPSTRLKIIQDELQSPYPDFWEFTDRGEDFYYLEPELKPYLQAFFHWFEKPPIYP